MGRARRTRPPGSLGAKQIRARSRPPAPPGCRGPGARPTRPAPRPRTAASHSMPSASSPSSRSRRTTQTSWSRPAAPRPLAVPSSARSPTALPKVARSRCREAASPCPSAIGRVSASPLRWKAIAPPSSASRVTARPVPSDRASASPSSVATIRCARASLLSRIDRVPETSRIAAGHLRQVGLPRPEPAQLQLPELARQRARGAP